MFVHEVAAEIDLTLAIIRLCIFMKILYREKELY